MPSAAVRTHRGDIHSAACGMHVYLRADRTRAGPMIRKDPRTLVHTAGRVYRALGGVPDLPPPVPRPRTSVGARAAHTSSDSSRSTADLCATRMSLTSSPHDAVMPLTLRLDTLTTTPAAAAVIYSAPTSDVHVLSDSPRSLRTIRDDDGATHALQSLAHLRVHTDFTQHAHIQSAHPQS